MANSTLLTLISNAAGEMGLAVPTSVIGNTNQDVTQFRYLINAIGKELVREHQWEQITKEYRFTTVFYTYTADLTSGSTRIPTLSASMP
jgi:hypothetical protein